MDRSAFGPSSPWPISWILNQVVIVLQEYNWRQSSRTETAELGVTAASATSRTKPIGDGPSRDAQDGAPKIFFDPTRIVLYFTRSSTSQKLVALRQQAQQFGATLITHAAYKTP